MALTAAQIVVKSCSKCGWVKPVSEFHFRPRAFDKVPYAQCKMCNRSRLKKYHSPERAIANEQWRQANMERVLERQRERRAKMPPELKRARFRAYAEKNRAKLAEKCRAYFAKQKSAMPVWANKFEILKFYEEARRLTVETGVLHHVDHIVPLTSDIVCGLHVHANLQVLTIHANSGKKNYHWPEMP